MARDAVTKAVTRANNASNLFLKATRELDASTETLDQERIARLDQIAVLHGEVDDIAAEQDKNMALRSKLAGFTR